MVLTTLHLHLATLNQLPLSDTITITFDKSHIITIGERLYGESLELIRELVCNAYDADASIVALQIEDDLVSVRDNGSGMDEAGLREYFRIGSQNKKAVSCSPRYHRERIGQFGIGKFAVLSACNRFRLFTQRGDFAAEVIFDRDDFLTSNSWHVPITRLSPDPALGDGTLVTLEALKRTLKPAEVERFIRERLPLTAPHFQVLVNAAPIEPHIVPGRKYPIDAYTPHGQVHGSVIVPNLRLRIDGEPVGIECVVRGVVVRRETFGLPPQDFTRILGRVTADFLPITSDRTRFLVDTPEYLAFTQVMQRELRRILREVRQDLNRRAEHKLDAALKDTLGKLGKALRRNQSLAPELLQAKRAAESAPDAPAHTVNIANAESAEHTAIESQPPTAEPQLKKFRMKQSDGTTHSVRELKVGGLGITCSLEHCGRDVSPAFTESGIIYLNQDHPLYHRQQEKGKDLELYLATLITQQVALHFTQGAHEALEIQYRLLTDMR
jgi:hypothetical protein